MLRLLEFKDCDIWRKRLCLWIDEDILPWRLWSNQFMKANVAKQTVVTEQCSTISSLKTIESLRRTHKDVGFWIYSYILTYSYILNLLKHIRDIFKGILKSFFVILDVNIWDLFFEICFKFWKRYKTVPVPIQDVWRIMYRVLGNSGSIKEMRTELFRICSNIPNESYRFQF